MDTPAMTSECKEFLLTERNSSVKGDFTESTDEPVRTRSALEGAFSLASGPWVRVRVCFFCGLIQTAQVLSPQEPKKPSWPLLLPQCSASLQQ